MPVFEFIIIIVLITTIGKVLMAVGGPMVEKLGDIARDMAASKKVDGGSGSVRLDADVVDELERRLARIEDRLDFLEELRAPDRRSALGRGLDRGGGRRGEMEAGVETVAGSSPTDEGTAGET